MPDLMLDLETLGRGPESAILSIGAVVFDPVRGLIGYEEENKFELNVDPASCQKFGMKIEGETVMWWLKQNDYARSALWAPEQVQIIKALHLFRAWYVTKQIKHVWAHGATFDPVIMAQAYLLCQGASPPWDYWDVRDTRTVYAAAQYAPIKRRHGAHVAINDAVSQAEHVCACYTKLGLFKPDGVPAHVVAGASALEDGDQS